MMVVETVHFSTRLMQLLNLTLPFAAVMKSSGVQFLYPIVARINESCASRKVTVTGFHVAVFAGEGRKDKCTEHRTSQGRSIFNVKHLKVPS